MELTQEQADMAKFYKDHFLFRRVYLIVEDDKWSVIAPKDRRPVNKAKQAGAQVFEFNYMEG